MARGVIRWISFGALSQRLSRAPGTPASQAEPRTRPGTRAPTGAAADWQGAAHRGGLYRALGDQISAALKGIRLFDEVR
ncbi:hypothetical protein, partial [Streptomyces sp. NPDC048845]|uniref:hypothetical protein n=1 Tax=Streptomyces sp. NPDC048845 TaxID=3155390 RepID=UPI00343F259E